MNDEQPNKESLGVQKSAGKRIIVALVFIVVLVAAVVLFVHWRYKAAGEVGGASVTSGSSIESIPGKGTPSAEYEKAQVHANVEGEIAARKEGTSFIPTITQGGFTGDLNQFGQFSNDSNCPMSKVVTVLRPNPENCTPEKLKLARDSGVTAEELLCEGCACPAMKMAGFTVGDLKRVGLSAEKLHDCGFDTQDLMDAGFTAAQLKNAGFTTAELRKAGFTAAQLKNAGFSAAELKEGGYSNTALAHAGFTAAQIQAADREALLCNATKLAEDRSKGMSAAELKKQGCGVSALRAAGFTAAELKNAGFDATQLREAGFSNAALASAGYTPAEIEAADRAAIAAESGSGSNASAQCDSTKLAKERAEGISANALKECGVSALKAAGFSAKELKAAGYTAGQLVAAGYDPTQLRHAGFTAEQLRNAGVSATALRRAGFGPNALKAAGFTRGDLARAGFAPTENVAAAQPITVAPFNDQTSSAVLPNFGASATETKLAEFEKAQQRSLNAQERQTQIQSMEAFMTSQAQKILSGWTQPGQQLLGKAAPKTDKGDASGTGGGTAAANAAAAAALNGPVIKAGSILFGVIDTSINSDEQTPIMARVVTGKLNGSILLGNFVRKDKKVLLQFDLLNDPHYSTTKGIEAVAIDPDTARTAISGQVNNHYLLRYGTLFASSFLSGISQALVNQNVTSDCAGGGGLFCIVKTAPLTGRQQIMVGLGAVGQAYATKMGQNFTVPPTIRIPAGTGIGILLTKDLVLPKAES